MPGNEDACTPHDRHKGAERCLCQIHSFNETAEWRTPTPHWGGGGLCTPYSYNHRTGNVGQIESGELS